VIRKKQNSVFIIIVIFQAFTTDNRLIYFHYISQNKQINLAKYYKRRND